MEDIIFFHFDCDRSSLPVVRSPAGIVLEIWRPNGLGLAPSCGLSLVSRIVWPLLHGLHLLGNPDYAIVCLKRNGVCVHRTLLVPPFFRFPFMAPDDLQCGDIWTAPGERGRGLAATGVAAAINHASRSGRRIWYLTESGNEPSIRLARRTSFSPIGHGRRTRRFGLHFFGQYIISQLDANVG